MARTKFTADYIPTDADLAAVKEQQAEYQKTHADPRHEYEAEYEVDGHKLHERVYAMTLKAAEEHIRQQAGLVGWIPRNLVVKAVSKTNEVVA